MYIWHWAYMWKLKLWNIAKINYCSSGIFVHKNFHVLGLKNSGYRLFENFLTQNKRDCRQQQNVNKLINVQHGRVQKTLLYSRLPHLSGSMDSSSWWRAGLWEGALQFSWMLCWAVKRMGIVIGHFQGSYRNSVHCSWDEVVLSSVRYQEEDTRSTASRPQNSLYLAIQAQTQRSAHVRSRNCCQKQGSTDM